VPTPTQSDEQLQKLLSTNMEAPTLSSASFKPFANDAEKQVLKGCFRDIRSSFGVGGDGGEFMALRNFPVRNNPERNCPETRKNPKH
jgi:hypothetical protein